MTVRTRFAPSPTGYLHVGGARTALFSWLYARKHQGTFVLRIEDTDLERSTQESVDAIFAGMQWLGLEHDEGPFYQTKRFDLYNEAIEKLLAEGKAYRCNCSPERLNTLREEQMASKTKPRYDRHCYGKDVDPNEPHVIRFLNPEEGEVEIDDIVRGKVLISNSELDDLIIRRTDGSPTYNLTVVIDDTEMNMTHVIRGDDHLNNTPRQINMMKALGLEIPKFAHLPMILGDDGSRLSKRHGAVSVMQYHDDGFLPEALLNYLVRLGWSHGDQELFTVEEMIELFDVKDVNKSAASFDTDKLRWINQQYILKLSVAELAERFAAYQAAMQLSVTKENADGTDIQAVLAEALQERVSTLKEMNDEAERMVTGSWTEVGFEEKAAKKALRPVAQEPLQKMAERLEAQEDWSKEALHTAVNEVAEALEVGMGKVGQPLRVALVGQSSSPSIDMTLQIVGKKAALERIKLALEYIDARIANG